MSEFQIKVRPEPYRTRAGEKVFVTGKWESANYPFGCSDGKKRTSNGNVWVGFDGPSDIIGDWEEPPAPASSPDRMEVWLECFKAAISGLLTYSKYLDDDLDIPARHAAVVADAGLDEYERRKGGGK